ncbi:hypothetical protein BD410DRAFT_460421 [Rickenella mellea]|uniref:AAA+ ATPase domain-containing protein n=1 Tax=Rickenella mellea TaxID=50990 RepID=A0A4Y7PUM7_9AGAM|nr:hypothetical protein BD410DRAFT_460421 [Rickenella mellea]
MTRQLSPNFAMIPALLDESVKQVLSAFATLDRKSLDSASNYLQEKLSAGSLIQIVSLLVVNILRKILLLILQVLRPPVLRDTAIVTDSTGHSEKKLPQWPLTTHGCRDLCATIVKGDLVWAARLLKLSPSLVNTRHPLGWTPLHTAVLSGNLAMLTLMAETPGVDFFIKDKSSFSGQSPQEDIVTRREEFSPSVPGTVSTRGMTALHFACMVGDWSIIRVVIDVCPLFEIKDDEGRVPGDYFDLRRVKPEVLDDYDKALKAWHKRCRALKQTDISMLCEAVRDGDIEFCRRTLEKNPSLIAQRKWEGWGALHSAVINKQHDILDLFLSKDEKIIDMRDYWSGSFDCTNRLSFASDEFAHRAQEGSTALHYACLMGDMVAADKLLRAGADWKTTDSRELLPEDHINVEHGDEIKLHFKSLCEEEDQRRKKKKEQEADKTDVRSRDDKDDTTKSTSFSHRIGDSMLSGEELERFKRENSIETLIGAKIIGQKGPIRSVASAIRLRENGWVGPDRPLVMLFLGSSGVGKTELAKQITYYLNGGFTGNGKTKSIRDIEESGAFIRIDMSEFQHSHTVSNLTGSPKGYVGYDEGGILTTKLRKNPKALVLLDEIEKAHPDVLTVFLQVFDDGRITDPKYGTIECKDAVFIMTSNLGSERIREAAPELRTLVAETEQRHEEYLRVIGQFNRDIHPILKKSLKRDEFLGRINQIVVFLPLNEEEISQVIGNELKKWRKRAAEQHSIQLSWSNDVVSNIVKAYDVNYGVRSVVNETQRIAVQLIAESQIRGDIKKNWLVHLDVGFIGDIEMKIENPKSHIAQRRGCRYFLYE